MKRNIRFKMVVKGKGFEREVARVFPSFGRRIMRSGAIGTLEGITQLMGDVVWKLPWFSKKILIEAKHGYGTAKSMTLKKEWFDKIDMEAGKAGAYPAFAFRFNDAKQARYIAFHLDIWKQLMDEVQALYAEMEILRTKEYTKKDNE